MLGEHLVTLEEAANDFGGVPISITTVRKYVYQGVAGLKLETIYINRRYTSKEAIQRFIAQRQNLGQLPEKPKSKRMTPKQIDEGLRKYGIRKLMNPNRILWTALDIDLETCLPVLNVMSGGNVVSKSGII